MLTESFFLQFQNKGSFRKSDFIKFMPTWPRWCSTLFNKYDNFKRILNLSRNRAKMMYIFCQLSFWSVCLYIFTVYYLDVRLLCHDKDKWCVSGLFNTHLEDGIPWNRFQGYCVAVLGGGNEVKEQAVPIFWFGLLLQPWIVVPHLFPRGPEFVVLAV